MLCVCLKYFLRNVEKGTLTLSSLKFKKFLLNLDVNGMFFITMYSTNRIV